MAELYGLWVQWLVVVVFQVDTMGFVYVCGCGLILMSCGGLILEVVITVAGGD